MTKSTSPAPKQWWPIVVVISAIAVITFPLFIFAPLQSDDFGYAMKGVSIQKAFSHYIGWSGRLLADTASSALLATRNNFLVSAFNLTALLAMLYFITAAQFGRIRNRQFALNFAVLFTIYWIGNSNLGQTTLWAVGSANYVYANALLCGVFYMLILSERDGEVINPYLLTATSFFAGIGNENMSVAVGAMALLTIVFLLWKRQRLSNLLLLAMSAYAIGSAVLILSPGNTARQAHFPDWYTLSVIQKLIEHVSSRVPSRLHALWIPIAAAAVLLVHYVRTRRHVLVPALFLAGAVISVAAMAAAPYLAYRSLNPTMVLLLLAISTMLPTQFISTQRWANPAVVIAIAIAPWSIIKISNQYVGYTSLNRQGEIRAQLINEGHQEVPKFYTGMLIDRRDGPDDYYNPGPTGAYYGSSPVSQYEVLNDYGQAPFKPRRKP